jgi:hypothetical protein
MLRLIAVAFAALAIWNAWSVATPGSFFEYAADICLLITAVGLWLRQRWSQYPVYVFSVFVVLAWILRIWVGLRNSGFQFQGTVLSASTGILISLLPVALYVGASIVVFRQWRSRS